MRRAVLLTLVALAAGLAGPSPAQASCVGLFGPGGTSTLQALLDAAPTVFVGTVTATAGNNRVARVRVESVWKGSLIPMTVTVSGTPDQATAATSVDRTFTVGQRYLFVPSSLTAPFQDSSCSATQPYAASLDSLKPATARPPAPGSDGLDPTGLAFVPGRVWFAIAAAVLLAGLAWWLLYRRRRGPRHPLSGPEGRMAP